MKVIRYAIIATLIVLFGATFIVFPVLPDRFASHWDASGTVNGYLPVLWGAFLVPLMTAGIVALFLVLPRIDPLRKNYGKFQRHYDGFIFIFALFMLVIQLQLLLWNTGYEISPNTTFPIIFGILFIYIGFLLEHAEQNWFVGIRTPWTLSSEMVWKKTHAVGGTLFKVAGIVSLFGILAGRYALWFSIGPVIAVAAFTVIYSYLEFRKETGSSKTPPSL